MKYLPVTPLHRCQIDSMYACTFVFFELLTKTRSRANTTCDFERGGATKPIIGSSWNSGVKNHLDLYQVWKHSNLIMLIVFCLTLTSVNALATLLESFKIYFFADTHTHRHGGIALPLLHMYIWGKNDTEFLHNCWLSKSRAMVCSHMRSITTGQCPYDQCEFHVIQGHVTSWVGHVLNCMSCDQCIVLSELWCELSVSCD